MKLRIAVAALAICVMSILPAIGNDAIAPPQADQQLKLMEKKFFEHDFSKEPEEYRIQRLEKFAFGQSETGNMDARLGRLEKVIDLHKSMLVAEKPPQQQPQSAQQSQPSTQTKYSRQLDDNQSQQAAHDKMKWVEDYRPRPATAYARPMQSVVPDEQRMTKEERELEDALKEPASEAYETARSMKLATLPSSLSGLRQSYDPSIFGDMPPDHHARMLIRVAWCEQHVFHRTFPELHLPQRLHQLSAELLPGDRESDLELMDHLDLLVREVVMQQHPPIAYGK
jgi:hypothetical protein